MTRTWLYALLLFAIEIAAALWDIWRDKQVRLRTRFVMLLTGLWLISTIGAPRFFITPDTIVRIILGVILVAIGLPLAIRGTREYINSINHSDHSEKDKEQDSN